MTSLRSISLIVWTLSAIRSVSGIHFGLALNRRQDLPNAPQCDSTCDPVEDIISTGSCPPSECCTELFQADYFDCLKCVGEATNATMADWTVAQNDVDALTVACSKEGFPLPELTLPTQNPNRTLATVSAGSQSSSHPLSQITISTLSSGSSQTPANTISQKTVTALSSQPSATQPPSTASAPGPTNSPSAAMAPASGFGLMFGLLGMVVASLAVV
ncbi:hypothetical protein MSAN_01402900 [Mycena sanguinolenta]|uniref:Uncharacterized protein n=1 Tax=Mycena sanguinolenta TaxID=230812 RepID=A0A8H6Y9G3_9AGAR|nr:hypothetical protein MSAN_01402900 [Mycena sanguinolenta]